MASQLPEGVTAQKRSDKDYDYIFLMNFSEDDKKIELKEELMEFINENIIKDSIILAKYEVKMFKKMNTLT
nr:Beta-galactosidase C-terminal domain [Halanaerobium congolense]